MGQARPLGAEQQLPTIHEQRQARLAESTGWRLNYCRIKLARALLPSAPPARLLRAARDV